MASTEALALAPSARGNVELDIFPLPHMLDFGKAQRVERAFDRLALRIEHAFLQRDLDLRLHQLSRS